MKKAVSILLMVMLFLSETLPCYPQASGEILGWKERTSGVTTYPYEVEADFTDNADGTISLTPPAADPGGSDTEIQFNNAGSFGGIAGFTYTSISDLLKRVTGADTQYGLKIDGQATTYTGTGPIYSVYSNRRVTTPASSSGVYATGLYSYISNSHVINGSDLFPSAGNTGTYNQISVTGGHSASPLVYFIESNYGDNNWLTRSGTFATTGSVTVNNYGTYNNIRDEIRLNSAGETVTVNNYGGKYEVTSGNYVYAGTLNVNTYGMFALARGDAANANSTCYAIYAKAWDGDTNYDVYLDGTRNIHANGGDMTITSSGGGVSFDDENISTLGSLTAGFADITDETNGYKIDSSTVLTVASVQNTYVGVNAGGDTSGNNYDTLIGYEAGYTIDSSTGRGEKNVFAGAQAGYGATGGTDNTGEENVGIGYRAMYYCGNGFGNTAVGFEAMHRITTGYHNVAIGRQALWTNQTGDANVAIGYNCMDNAIGDHNVALGYQAADNLTYGSANIILGRRAMRYNKTGQYNVVIGHEAGYGYSNQSYSNNTLIGFRAGYSLWTGSNNVFLGFLAGYGETGSNKLYIDNSSTTTPLIYGDFSADELTINGTLKIRDILELTGVTSDPSSPQDGSIWYRSDVDELRCRVNGNTYLVMLTEP